MAILLLYPVCKIGAEPLKIVYNPFTGKMDYITQMTSNTLPGGSTQYLSAIAVLDESILQGNATSFNMVGAGVDCVVVGNVVTCTITGGGLGGEPAFALFQSTGEAGIRSGVGFNQFTSTGQAKIESAGGFTLFRSTGESGIREGAGFRLFQSTGEAEINRVNTIQSQVYTIISTNISNNGIGGIDIAGSAIRSSHTNLSTDLLTIGSMSVVGSISSTSPVFGRQAIFSTMSVVGTITSTSGFIGPVSSITAQSVNPQAILADDSPQNGEVPKWNSGTNRVAWSADDVGGGSGSTTTVYSQNNGSLVVVGSSLNFTGAVTVTAGAGGVSDINVSAGSLNPTDPVTVGSMTARGSITTTDTIKVGGLEVSTITFVLPKSHTKNAVPNSQSHAAGWEWVGSSYSATPISTITVDMTGSTYAAYRFIFTSTAVTPGTGRDVMMTFNGDFEKRYTRRYSTSRRTGATITSTQAARGVLLLNVSTTSSVYADVTVMSNPIVGMKGGKYEAVSAFQNTYNIAITSNAVIPPIYDGRFTWNEYTQQISSVSFSPINAGVTGGFFGPPVTLKVWGSSELVP